MALQAEALHSLLHSVEYARGMPLSGGHLQLRQVLLKSCKTIPVMVGELLLDTSKKPSPQKITSVLVLTVGIGAFMFFKKAKKGGGSFEYNEMFAVGIGLVVLALICDAVYGPYQVGGAALPRSALYPKL
jgi:hypothetical protein